MTLWDPIANTLLATLLPLPANAGSVFVHSAFVPGELVSAWQHGMAWHGMAWITGILAACLSICASLLCSAKHWCIQVTVCSVIRQLHISNG